MREKLGDLLLIAAGAQFLFLFITIHIMGTYYIYEPNPIILWVETIMAAGIMVLGIDRLINDLKKK